MSRKRETTTAVSPSLASDSPRWLLFAVLILAAVAAYANSFHGPFIFDDEFRIQANQQIRYLWPIWDCLRPDPTTGNRRPTVNLTLAINHALDRHFGGDGLRVEGYHAVNLLIHILAGLTLFGLIRRTLMLPRPTTTMIPRAAESERDATPPLSRGGRGGCWSAADTPAQAFTPRQATGLAFITALLWLVHPLQTQSVTYIIQRGESLMGLCYLLTLYCLNRAATAESPVGIPAIGSPIAPPFETAAKRSSFLWALAAVAACAVGMGAKEVMVTAPVVGFVYDSIFLARKRVQLASTFRQIRWLLHFGAFAMSLILAGSTLWFLGLRSKAAIIAATVTCLLCHIIYVNDSFREALRRRWPIHLGLVATWLLLYVCGVFSSVTGTADQTVEGVGFGFKDITPLQYLATQPGVLLHYLKLSFWPRHLCLDYWWPVARTPAQIVPAGIIILAVLTATAYALFRRPTLAFLGIWFFLILAPTSSIVPMRDPAFEHRMYLPLAAVILAMLFAVRWLLGLVVTKASPDRRGASDTPPAKGGRGGGVGMREKLPTARTARSFATFPKILTALTITAITVAFTARTIARNADYHDPLRMWTSVVDQAPHNHRARNNLGNALVARGRLDEAADQFTAAIDLKPDYADAYNGLGETRTQQGRIDEAIATCRKSVELRPEYAVAHNNLGNALYQKAKQQKSPAVFEEAVAEYRQAIENQPEYYNAMNGLGSALLELGRFEDAIAEFQHVLQLNPNYASTEYNLGSAYFRRGQLDDAAKHYARAIELTGPENPNSAAAWHNLGAVRKTQGRSAEAVELFRKSLTVNPNFALAKQSLAQMGASAGR